jgi:hypothetical protein
MVTSNTNVFTIYKLPCGARRGKMKKCDRCKKGKAVPHFCVGDERLHGHGAVHTADGHLYYLCDACYEVDKEEWRKKRSNPFGARR